MQVRTLSVAVAGEKKEDCLKCSPLCQASTPLLGGESRVDFGRNSLTLLAMKSLIEEIEFAFPEEWEHRPISDWLDLAQQRLQVYWDHFPEKPLPQYVECDFQYVAAALIHCQHQALLDGQLFVEWGCGFGVVAGIASLLGLDAIGIEAEDFLCEEAERLLARAEIPAEIWQGNFLPHGAQRLADDSDPLVSLSHDCEPAYDQRQMTLEDFAMVFVYPWPGEEHFLKAVFQRFARTNALLLLYRGPYQIELYRKL